MKVINQLEQLPVDIGYLVVTLGNFDGVHRGHRTLIEELAGQAKEHQGKGLIFTFEPHPMKVIAPQKAPLLLNTKEEQIAILEKMGVDYILYYPFSESLAQLKAGEFVENFLYQGLQAKEIIIGLNVQFGYQREGNLQLLQHWGAKLGFKVKVVAPVKWGEEVVSSSRIRRLLLNGEIEEANELLAYPYFLSGKVIKGASRGRGMGFPTINMALPAKLIPANGVYATKAMINHKWYLGVSNLGVRPTFSENILTLETYFLDYQEEFPPSALTLHFLKRLREEKVFDSVIALQEQIQKDIYEAQMLVKT